MSELLSVALVCASTLLADACSRDTAVDILVAPAHTPMACLMQAQTIAAKAGLPGDSRYYLKVSCEHRVTDATRFPRAPAAVTARLDLPLNAVRPEQLPMAVAPIHQPRRLAAAH